MIFHYAAVILDAWLSIASRVKGLWRSIPGDLLGRAVMLGCGIPAPTRVHDEGDVRAIVVEDPRVARWFRAGLIPIQAQTLGRYVFARGPMSAETLAHECEHIRQWQRFGPAYLPVYFGSSAVAALRGRRAYWDNSFEVAARARARREAAADTPQDETRPKP